MASSIDQQWLVQHQTRLMMDTHPAVYQNSNAQFSLQTNSSQFNPLGQDLATCTSAYPFEQTVNQTSPPLGNHSNFLISNVQHHQQIYGPNSAVSYCNNQPATINPALNCGGNQIGNGFGSSIDYYPATECRNLHPISAYDHSGRNSSSLLSNHTTSSLIADGRLTPGCLTNQSTSYDYHSPSSSFLFGQQPSMQTTATAATTQTQASTQDPYYSFSTTCYPTDYYHHQQDPYSHPQQLPVVCGANYVQGNTELRRQLPPQPLSPQPLPPLLITLNDQPEIAADRVCVPAAAATTATTAAPSTARSSLAPTPRSPPCIGTSACNSVTAPTINKACCSSSSSKPLKSNLEANNHQRQQQQPQRQTVSSALLDSTSTNNSLNNSERKIKPQKGSSCGQQQQAEHLISSCHNNRVRAGPLGIIARRKNATRETTAILKEWLDEHGHNPYPSKGEKIMLSCVTKMSMTQVSTWFANARRRMKKERRFHSSNGGSGGGGGSSNHPIASTNRTSTGGTSITGGEGRAKGGGGGGPSSSLTKVKSEYAKAVMASSTGCPALKYFMQKHHKQVFAAAEHAPTQNRNQIQSQQQQQQQQRPSCPALAVSLHKKDTPQLQVTSRNREQKEQEPVVKFDTMAAISANSKSHARQVTIPTTTTTTTITTSSNPAAVVEVAPEETRIKNEMMRVHTETTTTQQSPSSSSSSTSCSSSSSSSSSLSLASSSSSSLPSSFDSSANPKKS